MSHGIIQLRVRSLEASPTWKTGERSCISELQAGTICDLMIADDVYAVFGRSTVAVRGKQLEKSHPRTRSSRPSLFSFVPILDRCAALCRWLWDETRSTPEAQHRQLTASVNGWRIRPTYRKRIQEAKLQEPDYDTRVRVKSSS
jgi:hypothetical protein